MKGPGPIQRLLHREIRKNGENLSRFSLDNSTMSKHPKELLGSEYARGFCYFRTKDSVLT